MPKKTSFLSRIADPWNYFRTVGHDQGSVYVPLYILFWKQTMLSGCSAMSCHTSHPDLFLLIGKKNNAICMFKYCPVQDAFDYQYAYWIYSSYIMHFLSFIHPIGFLSRNENYLLGLERIFHWWIIQGWSGCRGTNWSSHKEPWSSREYFFPFQTFC